MLAGTEEYFHGRRGGRAGVGKGEGGERGSLKRYCCS